LIIEDFDEDAELQADMWDVYVSKGRLENFERESLLIERNTIVTAFIQQEST
jgi:hypothetical protein